MQKRFTEPKDIEIKYGVLHIAALFFAGIWKTVKTTWSATWRILTGVAVLILVFGTAAFIVAGYLYFVTIGDVPKLEDPSKITLPQDSTIYSSDNKVIGVISTQRRYIVRSQEITETVRNAVVAIEDERFFDHEGVDVIGMARAVSVAYEDYKKTGDVDPKQGASTITQQYVRMAYLSPEKTMQRKLKEITLAVQLESRISKADILDRYLNTAYFGNGNYGVEAASRYYFQKHASELNAMEASVLAAILKSPTKYNPKDAEGVVHTNERRKVVLNKMYELGYITRDELKACKNTPIENILNIKEEPRNIQHPYYYDFVMRELKDRYSEEEIIAGGWQIYTTLSVDLQNKMAKVAQDEIGGVQGLSVAMTEIDPRTGAVVAFTGGDYTKSQFNVATQGKRQPGSSFKPFVYATAFKQGMRDDSRFSNAPITLPMADGKKWTVVPDSNANILSEGLAYSDNAMAVRLIQKTGVKPVVQTAHEVGITSEINEDGAIALGGLTYGVSTMEMANAFGTFANGGQYRQTYCIAKIENSLGDPIYAHKDEPKKGVNTEVAAMINKSLQGVVKYGTAKDSVTLAKSRQVAGKTGTTDDHSDTWFVGYTPQISVAVWMGNPEKRIPIEVINGETAWGGTFTARMWNTYVSDRLQGQEEQKFEQPQGLVEVPSDVSLSPGQMAAVLEGLNLRADFREVPNLDKPHQSIMDIESAGKLVPLYEKITVHIAIHEVKVPDYSGMYPIDAIVASGQNISVKFASKVTTDFPETQVGTVISQSISAGSEVRTGADVVLTLGFRTPPPIEVPVEVKVPYVPTDSELAQLRSEIAALNSTKTDLTERIAALQAELADERNRFVALMPDFTGSDAAIAQGMAASMGLRVTVEGTGLNIIGQSPAGGQAIPKDGAITLRTN